MWSSADVSHLPVYDLLYVQGCSFAYLGCNKWIPADQQFLRLFEFPSLILTMFT